MNEIEDIIRAHRRAIIITSVAIAAVSAAMLFVITYPITHAISGIGNSITR